MEVEDGNVTVPQAVDPTVPVLLPPPEQRIATAADVDTAKNDLRREMKLWLLAGGALGQGLAAILAVLVSGNRSPVQPVETALAALAALF